MTLSLQSAWAVGFGCLHPDFKGRPGTELERGLRPSHQGRASSSLGAHPLPGTGRGRGRTSTPVGSEAGLLPQGPGSQSLKTESITLEPSGVLLFAPLGWDLLGTHHAFLLYHSSLLERECPCYACPTFVFWKHILFDFTGSQLHRNFPQDELYLYYVCLT